MTDEPDEPAAFRCTYSDWKLIRTRKIVQLVFEVAVEHADVAYRVLGGMPNSAAETWCAIARLDPAAVKQESGVMQTEGDTQQIRRTDTSPASGPDIPARARKPVDPDKRLAQRAGILCADPLFWRYIQEHHGFVFGTADENEERAAKFVRTRCGVDSRANIKPNTDAGLTLDLIESSFICWRDGAQHGVVFQDEEKTGETNHE